MVNINANFKTKKWIPILYKIISIGINNGKSQEGKGKYKTGKYYIY